MLTIAAVVVVVGGRGLWSPATDLGSSWPYSRPGSGTGGMPGVELS